MSRFPVQSRACSAHSLHRGPRCTWVRQVIPEGEGVCLLGKEIPVLTYIVRINPSGAGQEAEEGILISSFLFLSSGRERRGRAGLGDRSDQG